MSYPSGQTPALGKVSTTVETSQGFGQKGDTPSGGRIPIGQKRNRRGAVFTDSGLLQSAVLGPEEGRQAAPRIRPVEVERVHWGQDIQNGDGSVHPQSHYTRRLGRLHRSARRLTCTFRFTGRPGSIFGFVSEGRFYQFRVLPFGICTAPRVFSKLMGVVAAAAG